ncbi:unnamed protein product [Heterosigma akashiwo]
MDNWFDCWRNSCLRGWRAKNLLKRPFKSKDGGFLQKEDCLGHWIVFRYRKRDCSPSRFSRGQCGAYRARPGPAGCRTGNPE